MTKTPSKLAIAKRISTSYEGGTRSICDRIINETPDNIYVIETKKTNVGIGNESEEVSLFYSITHIHVNQSQTELKPYLEKMIGEENRKIVMTKKDKAKYEKRNLNAATNNFLSKLLSLIGYTIHYRKTRCSNTTLKMNRINTISGHGIEYDSSEISHTGKAFNNQIRKTFEQNEIRRESPFQFTLNLLPLQPPFNTSSINTSPIDHFLSNFLSKDYDVIQNDSLIDTRSVISQIPNSTLENHADVRSSVVFTPEYSNEPPLDPTFECSPSDLYQDSYCYYNPSLDYQYDPSLLIDPYQYYSPMSDNINKLPPLSSLDVYKEPFFTAIGL